MAILGITSGLLSLFLSVAYFKCHHAVPSRQLLLATADGSGAGGTLLQHRAEQEQQLGRISVSPFPPRHNHTPGTSPRCSRGYSTTVSFSSPSRCRPVSRRFSHIPAANSVRFIALSHTERLWQASRGSEEGGWRQFRRAVTGMLKQDAITTSVLGPVLGFVMLYSLLPHKELRFLLPIVPVVNACAAGTFPAGMTCSRLCATLGAETRREEDRRCRGFDLCCGRVGLGESDHQMHHRRGLPRAVGAELPGGTCYDAYECGEARSVTGRK